MIFGLALSVGAITLVGNPPQTNSALITDIVKFGFSFLILINVWLRYTRIMSVLPLENRRIILLNTTLLFTVSIEPFLFNLLGSPNIGDEASIAYALDLSAMLAVLGFFTTTLANEERKLVPPDSIQEFRISGITTFLASAIFLVSAAPIFTNQLRFYLWIIPFVITFVRRGIFRKKNSKSS